MSRARAAQRPELGPLVARARARFARVSARKIRTLADLIRGRRVDEAIQQLDAAHRPSADAVVRNLLKSAVAGVTQRIRDKQYAGDPEALLVGRIHADSGPTLKRFQPRAMGRANQIRKRLGHLTIELYEAA